MGPCLSSFDLNTAPNDVPDMYSKAGTPCKNYAGYCDVFQRCREVDPSGPLANLRKLLLSERSVATFKQFIVKYWYTVIIALFAVMALMVTIVKICGKKTPLVHYKPRSENKYKSDHENFIVYVSNDKNSLPFKRRNSEHEPNSQNIESRNNRRR